MKKIRHDLDLRMEELYRRHFPEGDTSFEMWGELIDALGLIDRADITDRLQPLAREAVEQTIAEHDTATEAAEAVVRRFGAPLLAGLAHIQRTFDIDPHHHGGNLPQQAVSPMWLIKSFNRTELEIEATLRPSGFYVYVLTNDVGQPVYIGQSTNVMSRVGSHLNDENKAGHIYGCTLIRCPDHETMAALEVQLIRDFMPQLNILHAGDSAASDSGRVLQRTLPYLTW